jgi:predicted nucleotidyltransferase
MTIEALAAEIRSALTDRSDVRLCLVFGSFARGAAGDASDVDLAVDAPGVDLLALGADLALRLGREVDVVRLEDAGYVLLTELVRDGVVVHEARPGAAARWRSQSWTTLETDRPWFERMRDAWLRRVAERGI